MTVINKSNTPGDNGKVKIRWNSFAFYEIILPNGKEIVLDPYQYQADKEIVAEEDYISHRDVPGCDWIHGCDYVLLTHAHLDHVSDLPGIMKKYPYCELIIPDSSAESLLIKQNYNPMIRNIQIVGDNDRLEFEDFTLECFRGRHTVMCPADLTDPRFAKTREEIPYREQTKYIDAKGNFDVAAAGFRIWSTLEFRNYKISIKDGPVIFVWGGQIDKDYRRWRYTGMKPDIMLVQVAGTNVGNNRTCPIVDDLADFVMKVDPKLVLPNHQEKFAWKTLEYIGSQCNEKFKAAGTDMKYFNPKAYQWYGIEKGAGAQWMISEED